MESINEFIKSLDCFGVSYSFKYKSKEKYTTSLGGIITLLFIVLCLAEGIYNFIPFYNKKNFTTIYYILKLAQTEQIFFDKSKMAFSIGLNCWTGYDGTKAEDLFDIKYKYIYWDVQEGQYVSRTDFLGVHPCTYADFFNSFNKSFDDSKVYSYQCLDELSRSIEGIYASPVFSYYEFEVNAKNNSKVLLDKIEKYLIENDCKLQMYFIDKTIDIDDYKDPIKSYLETVFIQLNPTLSVRRNMYFMNQHLFDEDSLLLVFNNENDVEGQLSSLYSRYEEYSLYQGLNRTNTSSDYLNWAKLFFRADTRKTDVKRKYQNLMEFYADASCLLVGIYEILIIMINFINNFYAQLSLSKKIFFFKELDHNNLNLNKYANIINELVLKTNLITNPISKPYNIQKKSFQRRINIKKSEIIISDNLNNLENENNSKNSYSRKSLTNMENLSLNKFDVKNESYDCNNDKFKSYKLQTDNISVKQIKNNIYNTKEMKEENKNIELNYYDDYENINYDFNAFEVFITSFCKCFLTKNLGIKNNLNEKAIHMLNNNLDIVVFVRNQLLFNILIETMLDDQIKSIVNFLCRPIISINDNKAKNELQEYYLQYKEDDFNKCSEQLINLVQKPKKKIKEEKLIFLSNKHLKDLIAKNS